VLQAEDFSHTFEMAALHHVIPSEVEESDKNCHLERSRGIFSRKNVRLVKRRRFLPAVEMTSLVIPSAVEESSADEDALKELLVSLFNRELLEHS
jgi:hypothetical protein